MFMYDFFYKFENHREISLKLWTFPQILSNSLFKLEKIDKVIDSVEPDSSVSETPGHFLPTWKSPWIKDHMRKYLIAASLPVGLCSVQIIQVVALIAPTKPYLKR